MSDGADQRTRLSARRLLARNVGLAVLGQGAAVVIAVATVPVLIHALGPPRFGVLTLAWLLVGYAGLLDLGLGRALTKMTSERLGAGREDELPEILWTSLTILAVLGVLAAFVVAGLSGWLAHHVIRMPAALRGEAQTAFELLGLSVPAVLVGSGLRGFLEAHQRFELTNGVAVAISLLSYGGPAVVAQLSPTLPAVVGIVVASRYVACAINLVLVLRVAPALRMGRRLRRALIRPLLAYGGWVTATSIGSSVMTSLDRFVVAAVLSASAIAYYATPYQAVQQMLILSAGLTAVLFPAFALTLGGDHARVAQLFGQGIRFAFLTIFPLALTVVTLAPQILQIWLGAPFPARSGFVMQVFAVGILFNGMAQVVFGLVQSGRPDLTARVMALELPFYLGGFLVAVHGWGIDGAAVVWSTRAVVDLAALSFFARRMVPAIRPVLAQMAGLSVVALAALVLASLIGGVGLKFAFLGAAGAIYAALAWRRVLVDEERVVLRSRLGRWTRVGARA